MNRRIAVLALGAAAVLGLSACSGGTDPAPAETVAEESVADACASMSKPLQDASEAISGTDPAEAATQPQLVVDAWGTMGDAFSEAESNVSNPEVKAAVSAVVTETTSVHDLLKTVYIDGDLREQSQLVVAVSNWQESYKALTDLCTE